MIDDGNIILILLAKIQVNITHFFGFFSAWILLLRLCLGANFGFMSHFASLRQARCVLAGHAMQPSTLPGVPLY